MQETIPLTPTQFISTQENLVLGVSFVDVKVGNSTYSITSLDYDSNNNKIVLNTSLSDLKIMLDREAGLGSTTMDSSGYANSKWRKYSGNNIYIEREDYPDSSIPEGLMYLIKTIVASDPKPMSFCLTAVASDSALNDMQVEVNYIIKTGDNFYSLFE